MTKIIKSNNNKKIKNNGDGNNFWKISFFIFFIAIILALLIYFIPKTGIGSGQAVHTVKAGDYFVDSGTKLGAKLDFSEVNGVVGDTFVATFSIDSGQKTIQQVDFMPFLDKSLQLISVSASSNLNTMMTGKVCDINIPNSCTDFTDSKVYSDASAIWSFTVMDKAKFVSGKVDIAKLTFKINCPSGNTCNSEDIKKVILKKIKLVHDEKDVNGNSIFSSPLDITAQITIVPACIDTDKDFFGAKDTDLRGCLNEGSKDGKTNFDCDDTNNAMFPGNSEKCDAYDNNCDNIVNNNPIGGGKNKELRGVCYGDQVCTSLNSVTDWYESYLVADPNIKFNVVQQSQLYEKTKEITCDFYDNDCDGLVDEGTTGCPTGGASTPITLLPPGNVFVDYDGSGKAISPQILNQFDSSLFNHFKKLIDDNKAADIENKKVPPPSPLKELQGVLNKAPKQVFSKGNMAWICADGSYYFLISTTKELFFANYGSDTKVIVTSLMKADGANNLVCNNNVLVTCTADKTVFKCQ